MKMAIDEKCCVMTPDSRTTAQYSYDLALADNSLNTEIKVQWRPFFCISSRNVWST